MFGLKPKVLQNDTLLATLQAYDRHRNAIIRDITEHKASIKGLECKLNEYNEAIAKLTPLCE